MISARRWFQMTHRRREDVATAELGDGAAPHDSRGSQAHIMCHV